MICLWVLRLELRSSKRARNALNRQAVSPAPRPCFVYRYIFSELVVFCLCSFLLVLESGRSSPQNTLQVQNEVLLSGGMILIAEPQAHQARFFHQSCGEEELSLHRWLREFNLRSARGQRCRREVSSGLLGQITARSTCVYSQHSVVTDPGFVHPLYMKEILPKITGVWCCYKTYFRENLFYHLLLYSIN